MAVKSITIDPLKTLRDADYFIANYELPSLVTKVDAMKVDAEVLPFSLIGNVLGEGSLKATILCSSPNVNQWALFKPNGVSPFSIGDFCLYNHEAKPPTYIYEHQQNKTIEGEKNTNTTILVTMQIGEMSPLDENGNHHVYKNSAGDSLLGVGLVIDGVEDGSITEYILSNFPLTKNINYIFRTNEVINIQPYYYTRSSITHDWTKRNPIEDGSVTVTVNVLPIPFSTTTVTHSPATVDVRPGKTYENASIHWEFKLNNTSDTTRVEQFTWEDYGPEGVLESGYFNVSISPNSYITHSITTDLNRREAGNNYRIRIEYNGEAIGYSPITETIQL